MGILVWLLLAPLAGVGAVLLGTPRGRPQAAGVIALVASLVGAGLVAGLLGQFAYGSGAVQCVVGGRRRADGCRRLGCGLSWGWMRSVCG